MEERLYQLRLARGERLAARHPGRWCWEVVWGLQAFEQAPAALDKGLRSLFGRWEGR
jgi:hypothetical protein